MCDWNSGARPLATRSLRDGEQRADVLVQLVLRAVVGVQRDVDRVVLGDLGGELGQRDRAGDHVLDGRAGHVLGAAGGDLDDAVAAGLGEALQGRVEGLRGRHVDRRVGERAGLGAVEHLGVDLGRSDGHRCAPCSVAYWRDRGQDRAVLQQAVFRSRRPRWKPPRNLLPEPARPRRESGPQSQRYERHTRGPDTRPDEFGQETARMTYPDAASTCETPEARADERGHRDRPRGGTATGMTRICGEAPEWDAQEQRRVGRARRRVPLTNRSPHGLQRAGSLPACCSP